MKEAKLIPPAVLPEPNVWFSLGANIGDPARTILEAIRRIGELDGTELISLSPFYRSAPVGYLDQPPFLNIAASFRTEVQPEGLAAACRDIERELGRIERPKWHEREIDIDMLIYADHQIESPELTLPHPRMLERRFVIFPMADIAPELRHPITGQTMKEIRDHLGDDPGEWIEPLEKDNTEPDTDGERTPRERANDRKKG